MVATPGSSGAAGSARALTYRDRAVKAHDRYWPEVDKIEPFLRELEDKWNELAQSHLTVMGHFLRTREERSFTEQDANLVLGRMGEIKQEVVDIDTDGAVQWRTIPESGTGAIILPITEIAATMYNSHEEFLTRRAASNPPTGG